MLISKHVISQALSRLAGTAVMVAAGCAMLAAQTIVPAQALLVRHVYKPTTADSTLWTVEVENTSQNVITAYGVSLVCHYPDGTTRDHGVTTFDLVPLLAGRAGIMAQIEYLRSAKPEAGASIVLGEDPSFAPGSTRRDTFSPPRSSNGLEPDAIAAAPAVVIVDDGRSAGSPDDLATVFFGRNEELTKRNLLVEDLRAVQTSADQAGKLDERLNALATTSARPAAVAKSVPGQTHVFLDNPDAQRAWRREHLLLLKRQVGSAADSGLDAIILHYEAEAAVYARHSANTGK